MFKIRILIVIVSIFNMGSSCHEHVAPSKTTLHTKSMRADPLHDTQKLCDKPRDSKDVPDLEWELDSSPKMTWDEAKVYCSAKGSGLDLPTIWELDALVKQDQLPKDNPRQGSFWSSTPCSCHHDFRWIIGLSHPVFYAHIDSNHPETPHEFNVICVRR
ncbi:MAG: hypothetical protein WCK42_09165 [Myxococcaceae bacterium]